MKFRRPEAASASRTRRYAVVFDYDGTLIDTRKVKVENYRNSIETVFSTHKRQRKAIEESCLRTMGANRFLQLEDTLNTLGMSATEEQRQSWSRRYSALNRETTPYVPEFPSVRKLLGRLKREGYAVFAASGILEQEFLHELEERGLSGYFEQAVGGDKAAFLKSLKQRGYDPILFVGDTVYDQRTAEEQGVEFFRIDTDRDVLALDRYLS